MNWNQVLTIVLMVGFVVIVVFLVLILFRVFEILGDTREITKSARRTSKVLEVLSTRIIAPVSSILGAAAGVRRSARVIMRKRPAKTEK